MADSNAWSIDTVKTSTNGLSTSEIAIQAGTTYLDSSKVDASGLLRSAVVKQGSTTIQSITYGYDQARRLDTIKVGSSARTLLYYNADGLLVKRKLPSGDSSMVSVTSVHQPYTVKYGRSSLNSVLGAQYTLDTLNRIVARFNWAGDTSSHFAYDSVGRLTDYGRYSHSDSTECVPDVHHMDGQVCTTYGTATLLTSESYAYDSVGNRTDHSAALAGGNRLTSFNGYTLEYDADGNLKHKSKSGFDQHLYWNSINQLDSVTTNGVVVKFGYDAGGRRVRKTTSAATIRYIYSGDHVVAEVDQATGSVKRLYSYYPGVDAPHSMVEGGKTYYYLTESGAGSVVGLIDSTGVLKNSYRYAPYGLLEDSTEAIVNPLRYTAREYDAETQLYYYRARYYDPALARFISEDPAGQNAGTNQYAYAADEPVNRRDPTGLYSWDNAGDDCIPYTDGDCGPGGSSGWGRGPTTLGFAGPSNAPADWAKQAWAMSGTIDPHTGGMEYKGAQAIRALLSIPGALDLLDVSHVADATYGASGDPWPTIIYAPGLVNKTDRFHNFSTLVDRDIILNGLSRPGDNPAMIIYYSPGWWAVHSRQRLFFGNFEVGGYWRNQNTIYITHRFFNPSFWIPWL